MAEQRARAYVTHHCGRIVRRTMLVLAVAVASGCAHIDRASHSARSADHLEVRTIENSALPPTIRQYAARRPDESSMTYFTSASAADWRRPVLVYVEGSGAQSHFIRVGDRVAYGVFGMIVDRVGDRFLVAASEKRGVAFAESAMRGAGVGATEEYTRHSTLESRVAEVRLLLDAIVQRDDVDPTRVILIGHSEGADVAAAVAALDERVTHVAYLAGGGSTHFHDAFVMLRRSMRADRAPPDVVEREAQELEAQIRDILENPDSDADFYAGHSYRRWASFGPQSAAPNLVGCSASLFLAHGTEDEAVPIESFDHLVVEVLRSGRERVVIRRIPGADHSFIPVGAEPSNEPFLALIDEITAWSSGEGES